MVELPVINPSVIVFRTHSELKSNNIFQYSTKLTLILYYEKKIVLLFLTKKN